MVTGSDIIQGDGQGSAADNGSITPEEEAQFLAESRRAVRSLKPRLALERKYRLVGSFAAAAAIILVGIYSVPWPISLNSRINPVAVAYLVVLEPDASRVTVKREVGGFGEQDTQNPQTGNRMPGTQPLYIGDEVNVGVGSPVIIYGLLEEQRLTISGPCHLVATKQGINVLDHTDSAPFTEVTQLYASALEAPHFGPIHRSGDLQAIEATRPISGAVLPGEVTLEWEYYGDVTEVVVRLQDGQANTLECTTLEATTNEWRVNVNADRTYYWSITVQGTCPETWHFRTLSAADENEVRLAAAILGAGSPDLVSGVQRLSDITQLLALLDILIHYELEREAIAAYERMQVLLEAGCIEDEQRHE